MKTTYSFLFLTVLFFPFWAQAQNDSFIFTSENSWGYNKKGIKIDVEFIKDANHMFSNHDEELMSSIRKYLNSVLDSSEYKEL